MADTIANSSATYAAGSKGFVYGALIGALVAALGSFALAMINAGEGGPGINVAAGAAFGGGIGLLFGAIRGSRTASR